MNKKININDTLRTYRNKLKERYPETSGKKSIDNKPKIEEKKERKTSANSKKSKS